MHCSLKKIIAATISLALLFTTFIPLLVSAANFEYGGWVYVGGKDAFQEVQNSTDICAINNVPYVAYSIMGGFGVSRFDGTAWQPLGDCNINNTASKVLLSQSQDKPWIASQTSDGIDIRRFDGSSWVQVGDLVSLTRYSGGNGFSYLEKFKIIDGVPYVLAYSHNTSMLSLFSWDGSVWSPVGSSVGRVTWGDNADISCESGIPYVAYTEQLFGQSARNLKVVRYLSGSWQMVGDVISDDGSDISLLINQGTSYISYYDGTNLSHFKKYVDSHWSDVDNAHPNDWGVSMQLADGIFYFVTRNENLKLVVYDGANKIAPNTVIAQCEGGTSPKIVVCNGIPYVATKTGSNKFCVKRPVMLPAAPTNIHASANTNGSVTVSFSPVVGTDCPVDYYVVQANPGGITKTGTGSPVTLSGLKNGTSYTFTVTAVNEIGIARSAPSSPVTVTGGTIPPQGQPSWRLVGSAGFNSDSISSSNPALRVSEGTPSVLTTDLHGVVELNKYQQNGQSSPCWSCINTDDSSDSMMNGDLKTFGNVTYITYLKRNSSDHYFYAVVKKFIGSTEYDVNSFEFTDKVYESDLDLYNGVPYVVIRGLADNGDKLTVKRWNGASWENVGSPWFTSGEADNVSIAVDPDSGTPYVAFSDATVSGRVTVMKYDGSSWVVVGNAGISQGSASPSLQIYNSVPYIAYSDAGNYKKATIKKFDVSTSSWSDIGSGVISQGQTGDVSLKVYDGVVYAAYWNSPGDTVEVKKYDGQSWAGFGNTSYTTTKKVALDVYNGIPYIAVINNMDATVLCYLGDDVGQSVPEKPINVTAVAGPGGSATISFEAPDNDGGSPVNGYVVTSHPDNISVNCTQSPVTIEGLTCGESYDFTVAAQNAIGTGPDSEHSNKVTPINVPGAPENIVATAGDGQAVVSFNPPLSDGGSSITRYTVTAAPGGITATGTASPIVVKGLQNGTAYHFNVRAANAAGDGPSSDASKNVTPSGNGTSPGNYPDHIDGTTGADGSTQAQIPDFISVLNSNSHLTFILGDTMISVPVSTLQKAGTAGAVTISRSNSTQATQQQATSAAPAGTGIVSSFDLNLTGESGNSIHEFDSPVTVTVRLSAETVAKLKKSGIPKLFYFDPAAFSLVDMHATFDLDAATATFTTLHFSTYVIATVPTQAANAPGDSPNKDSQNTANVSQNEKIESNPKTGDNACSILMPVFLTAASGVFLTKTKRAKIKNK